MMMRGCVRVCRGMEAVEGLHLYSIYFLPLKVLQSFFIIIISLLLSEGHWDPSFF